MPEFVQNNADDICFSCLRPVLYVHHGTVLLGKEQWYSQDFSTGGGGGGQGEGAKQPSRERV